MEYIPIAHTNHQVNAYCIVTTIFSLMVSVIMLDSSWTEGVSV